MKHEDLQSLEGVDKHAVVLVVEKPGNDIEHDQLVLSDGFCLANKGTHHHEDIFLIIELKLLINEGEEGHDEFFDLGNQDRNEDLVLADVTDDVP